MPPHETAVANPDTMPTKSMEELVALCKRRGFVFPASEIYGGINGFWDFGPLGTELKNNLRDRWWRDMVISPPLGPDGHPLQIVGIDSAIIQNPKVWEASGHVGGFNDPMVDDKETKQRFRADQLMGIFALPLSEYQNLEDKSQSPSLDEMTIVATSDVGNASWWFDALQLERRSIPGFEVIRTNRFGMSEDQEFRLGGWKYLVHLLDRKSKSEWIGVIASVEDSSAYLQPATIPSPFTGNRGSLTAPRQFNLMYYSYNGPIHDEDNKVYLRPETAQGIFTNFKNIVDTMRVKMPFGIAQIGKSFRNEVTPRNFIFRAREFEQMEMEWFCHEDDARAWYEFWVDARLNWWKSIGASDANLQRREHDQDELAHYSTACADVEFRYPFTAPGFGELEGIAHRGCFDLNAHQEASGNDLTYFDQELQVKLQNEGVDKEQVRAQSRYLPHVIEPAAGLTRGALALLCEAFTPDPERPSGVVMKFHPSMAPIKAGIFPLVAKDGMPEVAEKLYLELRKKWPVQYDVKQSVGKRYARMDEAGTPYCFTVDGETLENNTVTVRDRDTAGQERINLDQVDNFLADRIGA